MATPLLGEFSAGPLYDRFPLTLAAGRRVEAAGPFYFAQHRGVQTSWGMPPFFSRTSDPDTDSTGYDVLYPILTYHRFGSEYRWQFCQLFSFSGGQNQAAVPATRFTLFPFYFQQRSPDSNLDYTAVAPFYGHLKHRLFRDDIRFVMFPLYSRTRKRDVVTRNYLYPFFDVQHGIGLHGWQCWPLVGYRHKVVTTATNGFGDIQTNGGYTKIFVLWPVHFYQNTGLGTTNPARFRADLPLYAVLRSPRRDSTSILWPFFSWINDRGKKYREWEGPYPFVVVARGPGKTATRVWPLFSRAHNAKLESDYYLWPLYRYDRTHSGALDWRRTRILFYLFEDSDERNTETHAERKRIDVWPLFVWHRDFNGNRRLQILAPIEPVLPDNPGVQRNWSPLWSLWRSSDNPRTGAASQSLLWNLYRRDTSPTSKKCSFLFGLFQYQHNRAGTCVRLFYLPICRTRSAHP